MGTDPAARALRQSARMEGEQLLPADARFAEWPQRPATQRIRPLFGDSPCCPQGEQGRLIMPTLKHATALRREFTTADQIPYTAHVAPMVVKTAFGDYLQAFRLGGSSFESSDDEDLNNWHERLNVLWRNIASPNVALWTQVIRRRAPIAAEHEAPGQRPPARFFADSLHAKYRRRLANETLMINDVYLAVVHRPTSGVATGWVSKALVKMRRDGSSRVYADALDTCEKLVQTFSASLARYEPDILGIYRSGNIWCSSLLEY